MCLTVTDNAGARNTACKGVTVEEKEEVWEVKIQGTYIGGNPNLAWQHFPLVKIDKILSDPLGALRIGEIITVSYTNPYLGCRYELPNMGGGVEVFGETGHRLFKVNGSEGHTVQLTKSYHYVTRLGTQGTLVYFDLDYRGNPPNSDGNEQRSITAQPGASLTLFFRYNEGNAGNQYVVRVYAEWDRTRPIANSDNDETISEVGAEIGGYRWDKEAYTAPSTPGTYKVRVVYSASATPPTWDRYDKLLAEGTIEVLPSTGNVIYVSTVFTSGNLSKAQIMVPVGAQVSVMVILQNPSETPVFGRVKVEVRKDIVTWPDQTHHTLIKQDVSIPTGTIKVPMGSFTATDETDDSSGKVRQYYVKVYWNDKVIHDPTDPKYREWVKTFALAKARAEIYSKLSKDFAPSIDRFVENILAYVTNEIFWAMLDQFLPEPAGFMLDVLKELKKEVEEKEPVYSEMDKENDRLLYYISPFEWTYTRTDLSTLDSTLQSLYKGEGFSPPLPGLAPSYRIDTELAFMHHLAKKEYQAWLKGDSETVKRLQNIQKKFLEDHLLRWVPSGAPAKAKNLAGWPGWPSFEGSFCESGLEYYSRKLIEEGSLNNYQKFYESSFKLLDEFLKTEMERFQITLSFASPPSLGGKTVEKALDLNQNYRIDDDEMLRALQYWISGKEVPGTGGQTIDDAKMLELLHIWTSRRPISSASAQSRPIQTRRTESLTVREIKLSPNPVKSTHPATFRAEGSGIAGIKVEVFNLAGMKVSEEEASGNTLRFYALDDRGRPLANGVYLYVVTVRGFNGEAIRSEIRKLVILR